MKKNLVVVIMLIILGFIFFTGCSSTTLITSDPPNAKVYINNSYVGNTPLAWSDTKPSLSCTPLTLEKEGYKTINSFLCKDEEINVGAAIGGFFCWPFWIWVYEYFPEHKYVLKSNRQGKIDTISYSAMKYTVDDSQNKTVSSKAEKLKELKDLYDQGILTKEEYENEKQKILKEENW